MKSLLHIKSLRKTKGDNGLLDIKNFDILAESCIVLSGRNGAGKTTLLKILAGLEAPDNTELTYEGKTLSWQGARPLLQRDVVYLHQQAYMFDRSVAENIGYGLRFSGLCKSDIGKCVEQALSWAGLTHLAERNAQHLSGGEKQRVALTRARILSPKLLLLDEPVANMDLESREKTIKLIQCLKLEGITTIITSHEPHFAQLLSDDHRHLCKTGPSRYTIVEPFLYKELYKELYEEHAKTKQADDEKNITVKKHSQAADNKIIKFRATGTDSRNSYSQNSFPQGIFSMKKSDTDIADMKTFNPAAKQNITAVILAGGRAQRMGGQDKGLLDLQGKPLIEHIIKVLRPQVDNIIINANRNQDRYAQYGYPVVSDIIGEYFGPLVGMASGMQNAQTEYVLTVPCDSPLLPENLVSTLYNSLQKDQAELSVAHDGERMQPVFALLRCDLLPHLLRYLEAGGRKIDTWYAQHHTALADFSNCANAFMNINSLNDQLTIEQYLNEAPII